MIKGSSSVAIESVQKSAEQVEGGGREGAAGHEVERNDGEDNPGITLGWTRGRQGGISDPARGPSPSRSARSRGQHSPMRLGTNRKIFSPGIAAAPSPPRARSGGGNRAPASPRGLTSRPRSRRAHSAQAPAVPVRPQVLGLAASQGTSRPRGASEAGARTPRPPPGQAFPPPAAAPAAPAEPGVQNWRGRWGRRGSLKMAAAPLRPARFLFLPPPLSIGLYQSAGGGGSQRGLGAEQRREPRRRCQKRRRLRPMLLFSPLQRVQLPGYRDKEKTFRPPGSVPPREARLLGTGHSVFGPAPSRVSFAPAGSGSERPAREAGGRPRGELLLARP